MGRCPDFPAGPLAFGQGRSRHLLGFIPQLIFSGHSRTLTMQSVWQLFIKSKEKSKEWGKSSPLLYLSNMKTFNNIEEKKEYWRAQYQRLKHTPKYVATRKRTGAVYRKRHTFQQLAKAQRKESKVNIPRWELARLFISQKGLCRLTGEKLTRENISLDHIIPKIRGGGTGIGNLSFVTKEVNLAKHKLLDVEFVELCKKVISHVA